MSCNNTIIQEKKEKLLIQSGDLLNSVGILRSAKIHNCSLTKVKFIELVKKNYYITNTIPPEISHRVETIRRESINLFEEIGINDESTSYEIKIKEITLTL